MVHQEGRGTLGHGLGGEGVAVPLGAQGDEAGPRLEGAGVQGEARGHHSAIPKEARIQALGEHPEIPEGHGASAQGRGSGSPRRTASTAPRSL